MKRKSDHVPIADRLDLLRQLDTTGSWRSLDDERICLLCERRFAGRQVDFTQSGNGRVHVHCPTADCTSTPREWVHLNDSRIVARQRKKAPPLFALPATA